MSKTAYENSTGEQALVEQREDGTVYVEVDGRYDKLFANRNEAGKWLDVEDFEFVGVED